jgi:hypothetical protein
MTQTRNAYGPDKIVMGNGFTAVSGQSTNNGYMIEPAFMDLNPVWGLPVYLDWSAHHYGSFYGFISVHGTDNTVAGGGGQTGYRQMRSSLAATLMGDGFYNYGSGNSGSNGDYSAMWWYDEYAVDLSTGKATGDASHKGYLGYPTGGLGKDLGTGVWRRDFQNGIVLVNESGAPKTVTLETTYRRISGTQDPATNSGASTTSVTLNYPDGIILIR